MKGNETDERVDVHPAEERALRSRRPASNGHADHPRCRRCGGPVRGRRRNGFCSNRCRLAERREARRRNQLELLATINTAVEQLRATVEVKVQGTTLDGSVPKALGDDDNPAHQQGAYGESE
jgi:hypothetical protein